MVEVVTLQALFFDRHEIVFPFNKKTDPDMDLLSSLSLANSESEYPLNCDLLSETLSDLDY